MNSKNAHSVYIELRRVIIDSIVGNFPSSPKESPKEADDNFIKKIINNFLANAALAEAHFQFSPKVKVCSYELTKTFI